MLKLSRSSLRSCLEESSRISRISRRYQSSSSSKKDLNVNNLKPVTSLPSSSSKKLAASGNGNNKKYDSNDNKIKDKFHSSNINSSTSSEKLQEIIKKPRLGFSSLPKVSSTYSFHPKDLLLDNFFSGYRPMTLPIQQQQQQLEKPKYLNKISPQLNKSGAYVYFEIDDNLDFLNDLENTANENPELRARDIERKTSTRFDHSHKSLKEQDQKNEEYEKELYESKNKSLDQNTKIAESKRSRGRRRIVYNMKKEEEDNNNNNDGK
ncbi:hypothetical protein PACTADRAFT_79105 [Pachysolen tannophilus NRRL Y-2460]|uniref:Uncharacterized protein n=1 Tax=Pachysolen tannophilus NRRL Y-2460 TaxID=669874 RepID=A0A1E4TY05_PACTA|nr:hypothetical protein PACTADRAFT_79105 [Pachysolen tannophilus NRRL Y-2460]